ncbi:MAG TPA: J domain-containing protein [Blastocatellia bacterium]|nr:J domain-containing protein [Blastocatellia bacterium]
MVARKFDSSIDYYCVLGIREDATQKDVDRAFRKQARTHHPDGGGSDEEMKSLNEAHDILSDPETRRAYDAERRPRRISYPSSMAFDPEAASRAGTLKIPVSDPDLAGLLMGAAACFCLGIPLLLLVEMQWVFFLWPLRIMSLAAIAVGVYLTHSALSVKRRKVRIARPDYPRSVFVLQELAFWVVAVTLIGTVLAFLYVL